jgi:divalent metal cation (Fe/Co/Zn/Cd) transporter
VEESTMIAEQHPIPGTPSPGPGRSLLPLADSDPGAGCSAAAATAAAALRSGSPEWVLLARRARLLSWISLGWLGIEGAIAIVVAVLAGSVALLGFGIDSAIEALASIIVVWRFSGARTVSTTAETTAQKAVAVSFFLLAPYIAAESVRTVVVERHAETSWLGVTLAVVSLMWCPALGVMKTRLGVRLNSAATTGEGRQNLLCAYLAVAVLVGLLANTLFGIWWLDPAVGLLIAALAVREGRRAWQGQTCACC